MPGASQKMLAKSQALNLDTIIYDLEDSVTPDLKADARHLVAKHIAESPRRPNSEVSVRINAVETGLALHDLTDLVCPPSSPNRPKTRLTSK